MKFLFLLLFTAFISAPKAEIPEGVWVSNSNSFKANYYLKITKDEATLLGWDTTIAKNTVYFRSACKRGKKNRLTFEDFSFSKSKNSTESFKTFKSDPNVKIENFLLNRYFFDFETGGNVMTVLSAKDMYDSRIDRFEFVKIK